MTRFASRSVVGVVTAVVLCFGAAVEASAQSDIEAAVIYPPMAARYQCSEHPLGDVDHVGDALGADCVVVRREGGPNGDLYVPFRGDGTRNEDWFSWREPVLAPFEAVVTLIHINPETTIPGQMGPGRSSAILFRRGLEDDPGAIQVAYIHVREVTVSVGDTVRAGQPVAVIGNNGSSFNPHLHIGAFRGELYSDEAVPLQIRMDLAAMGRLRGLVR